MAKKAVEAVLAKQRMKPGFGNAGAVRNLLQVRGRLGGYVKRRDVMRMVCAGVGATLPLSGRRLARRGASPVSVTSSARR